MYLLILIILILLSILFLFGLIIFVRSLILKKNRGWGIVGLLTMIIILLIYRFSPKILDYQSESDFINSFESVTQLSYPCSGKIIERKYEGGISYFGDYMTAGIIEMDTLDFKKLLREVQLNKIFDLDSLSINENPTPSFFLKKNIPANEFACVYQMKRIQKHDCCLWFHKNEKTVVYEDIKN
jgi:hypothetical protein